MKYFKLLSTVLSLVLIAGCGSLTPVQPGGEKEVGKNATTVLNKKIEHILIIAVQRTGTTTDDRTFAAIDTILKSQRTQRAGENDKIMLVEISDKGGPVTSGSPRAFKAKYPDGEAVRKALKTHDGPTRVYDILSQTVRQVRGMSKDAQVTLVVFTAFKDGLSGDRAMDRMNGALIELERHNNLHVLVYGVDQFEADRLRPAFEAWLRRFTISTAIEEDPDLPGWGDE